MAQGSGSSRRVVSEAITPECSVVIPLCNESENLPQLHARLLAVLRRLAMPFEIIYVDDGSTDGTRELIQEIQQECLAVKALFLSRNFGHQAALSAGLEAATGRAVVTMDGDLQDPPELIPEMLARWREGCDIVYARRGSRRGGTLHRIAYCVFYRVLRGLSELPIPLDTGDFAMMDSRVLEVLNSLPERNRFIRGLRTWVGFQQGEVVYDRDARQHGRTKYTLHRLVGLALDGIFGFSDTPLKIVSAMGWVLAAFALVLLAVSSTGLLAGLGGRAAFILASALILLGGIQMIGLGIVGEYAYRAYTEGRARPLFVIAKRLGFEPRHRTPPNLTNLLTEQRGNSAIKKPYLISEELFPCLVGESEQE